MTQHKCWLLFDATKKGSQHQCMGLAHALNLPFILYPIKTSNFLRYWPHFWWIVLPIPFKSWFKKQNLCSPWPAIIICSGRIGGLVAAQIKKRFSPKTMVIILQKPALKARYYDWIVCPHHDCWQDTLHTHRTLGSLHHIQEDALQQAAEAVPWIAPSLRTLILIGHIKNQAQWSVFTHTLKQWYAKEKQAFMIVPSRRTDSRFIDYLARELDDSIFKIWSGKTPNPYISALAQADRIVVTGDSINMLTESCYTGKPVYIWRLKPLRAKFNHFHKHLVEGHHAYFFEDYHPSAHVKPLREVARIAQLLYPYIKQHLLEFFDENTSHQFD